MQDDNDARAQPMYDERAMLLAATERKKNERRELWIKLYIFVWIAFPVLAAIVGTVLVCIATSQRCTCAIATVVACDSHSKSRAMGYSNITAIVVRGGETTTVFVDDKVACSPSIIDTLLVVCGAGAPWKSTGVFTYDRVASSSSSEYGSYVPPMGVGDTFYPPTKCTTMFRTGITDLIAAPLILTLFAVGGCCCKRCYFTDV